MSAPTPDALSPSLILAHPTPDEQVQIWSENFPAWGRGLTLTDYLLRENSMLTHPLCTNDGFQSWILTTNTTSNDAPRPILSSCETYRKRAVLRDRHGIVRDTHGYGIASVFTYERHRRRGYATRMMALLRDLLNDAPCSVLYSDVGSEFYARHGWVALHSAHLVFPVHGEDVPVDDQCTRPISDAHVPALAELDEELIRRELSSPVPGGTETRVAFLPTADVLSWHFTRDDFFCRFTLGRAPTVRGAIYTPTASPDTRGGAKVWAVWTGVYNGGMERLDKNVLYINRFVVQDDSIPDEELSDAIRGILAIARGQAREWLLASIHWWNPSERIKRLSAEMPGLNGTFVIREDDSLCSLNWFGPESINDVEWVANERFVWC